MLSVLLTKIIGSSNDRYLKKIQKTVERIGSLESTFQKLSDDELQAKTNAFRARLNNGESLDGILPEAFATVREAGKRVYGMRLFDVQMIGGIVLHHGMISEMKTGEGKTFVATLACYLNGLAGKGVHVVTVNDYLVSRDAAWAGKLYHFLGLTVGTIVHGLSDNQRRQSYGCDITYATNHELGFDYLRDNMKFRLGDMVHRPFNFAIVDEADNILIDEARTPLIISGSAEDSSDLYEKINDYIPQLLEEDIEKDEKQKSVMLTEVGVEKLEAMLMQAGLVRGNNLYDAQNISLVHHINCALRSHKMFARDVDYIVKDGKVIIIDEFTGRMMDGRRYSDGLHQALEAKEGVEVEMENQTLASITYQNYFRLYKKLGCMTGTAMTEAAEFEEIYKVRTIAIPTNKPVKRSDLEDDVYLTAKEKYDAVITLIKECHARQQPVLVGTVSIEKSEFLHDLLKKAKIPHQVLNARYHEQEALIISQAGCPGAVTIATNMAGRGTDIKLGGNLEMMIEQVMDEVEEAQQEEVLVLLHAKHKKDEEIVIKAGGLFVIGTERHESRRIDNQLRGRAGRQGDPGGSKFYVSLEDDLMRIFGSERLDTMLRRLGVQEGEAISHTWISKALMRAQQKVEARNFDVRKHLLRYDDVMNDQRKIIYQQRLELMNEKDVSEMITAMRHEAIEDLVQDHIPNNSLIEGWDLDGLHAAIHRTLNLNLPVKDWAESEGIAEAEIMERIITAADAYYAHKEEAHTPDALRYTERMVLLRTLDTVWKEHLLTLDHLRQGINLRAYAQNNPLNEYKREAFTLFQVMLKHLREDVTSTLCRFEIPTDNRNALSQMLAGDDIDFDDLKELLPHWMETEDNEDEDKKENVDFSDALIPFNTIDRRIDDQALASNSATKRPKTRQKLQAANAPSSAPTVLKTKAAPDKSSANTSSKSIKKEKDTLPSTTAKKSTRSKKVDSSSAKAEEFEAPLQRNADCPCGSGKKYKHCHGALEK